MEVRYLTQSHEVIDFVSNAIYSIEFDKGLCGFDTEGTGLDPYTSEIRLYQFSVSNNLVYVIDRWKAGKQLVDEQVRILFNATKKKLKYSGHNLKYEIQMLWSLGICLFGNRIFDTMLAAQVIEQGIADTFNMKDVAYRFLRQEVDKTEQVSDWSIKDLAESQIYYAAKDTVVPRDLYHVQTRAIIDADLQEAFKLEMRTIFPTASMEYNGVKLNTDKLINEMQPYYEQELSKAEESFLELATTRYVRRNFLGNVIDPGVVVSSSSQVLEVFRDLGIPNPEDESELIPSTGKDIVKLLDLEKYPIVEALLNYRELSKLLTSFIVPLPQMINPVSGRLHTHYNQCVSTGRFCIAKDTEIRLVGGTKRIQDINIGDFLYTVNDINEPICKKVTQTFYTGRQYCIKLKLSNSTGSVLRVLKCTPNHKIKTLNRGWVAAMSLTKEDLIVSLADTHYKVLDIIYGTYLDTYDLEVDEVHCFIANDIVVHNSSSSPNLQQIPRPKSNQPFSIRECFIAEDGYDIVLADYSQIELRVIAEVIYQLTGDDSQLKEFLEGKDPYANTAAKLSGMTYEEFVALDKAEYKKRRQAAKAVRLGFNYCGKEDTKVITSTGIKQLKDLQINDHVLTHLGNYKRVTETQQVTVNEYLKITTRSGKVLEVTKDHVLYSILPRNKYRKQTEYVWIAAQELSVGDYLVENEHEYGHADIPYFSNLDLAYLVGWFVSEGYYSRKNARHIFYISQDKKINPDIYQKMKDKLVPAEFYEAHENRFKLNADNCRLLIPTIDIDWDALSADKNLSRIKNKLTREEKIALVGALWDGDGCICLSGNRKAITYASLSKQLVSDIQEILATLAINSKIRYLEKRNIYYLHILGHRSMMKFIETIDTVKVDKLKDFVGKRKTPVKTVERVESIELIVKPNTSMYDITVEDDHSFIANGLVSSNCMGALKFKNYARINYGVPMTQEEAERSRRLYFESYPGLGLYHNQFKDRNNLEVRTLPPFRRRRRWLEYPGVGGQCNLPIQGSSGDVQKLAMSLIFEELYSKGYSPTQSQAIKMILTIHDELELESKQDLSEEMVDLLSRNMITAGEVVLKYCPVLAEAKAVQNLSQKD
jgi:DNA polymerase I-like protein with 3'-5' exonuclease and polymerase domains